LLSIEANYHGGATYARKRARTDRELVLTFFEHLVPAARDKDGTIYMAISDLCEAAELNTAPLFRGA